MNAIEHNRALNQFDTLRRQATWRRWWHRLRGRPQTLLPLAPLLPWLRAYPTVSRGVQQVPLRHIVGSVGRAHEYDRDFRPLTDTARERWVGVHLLNQYTGWEPVQLIKVGNLYFVVDGHHRLSVARQNGLPDITAVVEAYAAPLQLDPQATLETILAQLHQQQQPRSLPHAGRSLPCACA